MLRVPILLEAHLALNVADGTCKELQPATMAALLEALNAQHAAADVDS